MSFYSSIGSFGGLTSSRCGYQQVTFIEALDGLMPGFDPEIGKLAQRILINPRKIDYHVGVLAKKVRDYEIISFEVCIFFFFLFLFKVTQVCVCHVSNDTTSVRLQNYSAAEGTTDFND